MPLRGGTGASACAESWADPASPQHQRKGCQTSQTDELDELIKVNFRAGVRGLVRQGVGANAVLVERVNANTVEQDKDIIDNSLKPAHNVPVSVTAGMGVNDKVVSLTLWKRSWMLPLKRSLVTTCIYLLNGAPPPTFDSQLNTT